MVGIKLPVSISIDIRIETPITANEADSEKPILTYLYLNICSAYFLNPLNLVFYVSKFISLIIIYSENHQYFLPFFPFLYQFSK